MTPRSWADRFASPGFRWALAGAVFLYYYVSLVALFRTGEFWYDDVTVINDLLDNGAFFGKPFWVTDYDFHHFYYHFTPSLIFLVPLKWIFRSQFWLLAANLAACGGAVWAGASILKCLMPEALPGRWRGGLLTAFVFWISVNLFLRSVVLSAHFESFYLFFGLLLAFFLIDGRGWKFLLPTALLALGVRQDTGLFLAFLCLAIAAAPAEVLRPGVQKKAFILAGVSVVYLVGAMQLMKLWGGATDPRMWKGWGATWGEVLVNVVTSPRIVVSKTLYDSAFTKLNGSLGWMAAATPLPGVFANLPGALFYTSFDDNRPHLKDYNSALLLPALLLVAALSVARGSRRKWIRGALLSLMVVQGIWGAVTIARVQQDPYEHEPNKVRFYPRIRADREKRFMRALRAGLAAFPEARSVATDFSNIVYVPGNYRRYLLRHFEKADLVILEDGGSLVAAALEEPRPGRTGRALLGAPRSCDERDKFEARIAAAHLRKLADLEGGFSVFTSHAAN